jgi:hypothetical protein
MNACFLLPVVGVFLACYIAFIKVFRSIVVKERRARKTWRKHINYVVVGLCI